MSTGEDQRGVEDGKSWWNEERWPWLWRIIRRELRDEMKMREGYDVGNGLMGFKISCPFA